MSFEGTTTRDVDELGAVTPELGEWLQQIPSLNPEEYSPINSTSDNFI